MISPWRALAPPNSAAPRSHDSAVHASAAGASSDTHLRVLRTVHPGPLHLCAHAMNSLHQTLMMPPRDVSCLQARACRRYTLTRTSRAVQTAKTSSTEQVCEREEHAIHVPAALALALSLSLSLSQCLVPLQVHYQPVLGQFGRVLRMPPPSQRRSASQQRATSRILPCSIRLKPTQLSCAHPLAPFARSITLIRPTRSPVGC